MVQYGRGHDKVDRYGTQTVRLRHGHALVLGRSYAQYATIRTNSMFLLRLSSYFVKEHAQVESVLQEVIDQRLGAQILVRSLNLLRPGPVDQQVLERDADLPKVVHPRLLHGVGQEDGHEGHEEGHLNQGSYLVELEYLSLTFVDELQLVRVSSGAKRPLLALALRIVIIAVVKTRSAGGVEAAT